MRLNPPNLENTAPCTNSMCRIYVQRWILGQGTGLRERDAINHRAGIATLHAADVEGSGMPGAAEPHTIFTFRSGQSLSSSSGHSSTRLLAPRQDSTSNRHVDRAAPHVQREAPQHFSHLWYRDIRHWHRGLRQQEGVQGATEEGDRAWTWGSKVQDITWAYNGWIGHQKSSSEKCVEEKCTEHLYPSQAQSMASQLSISVYCAHLWVVQGAPRETFSQRGLT